MLATVSYYLSGPAYGAPEREHGALGARLLAEPEGCIEDDDRGDHARLERLANGEETAAAATSRPTSGSASCRAAIARGTAAARVREGRLGPTSCNSWAARASLSPSARSTGGS